MANKAVFLDRDDTLIEDPGYINHPDQVKLLGGVADALDQLSHLGYKLIVVTNQSAIARGIIDQEQLEKIHLRMKQLLAQKNVFLDAIYYCPYHPDGVIEQYRKGSEDRKPSPGMLLKAASDMDIDLNESWMVGNSYSDIAAGQAAGTMTVLINSPVNPTVPERDDPRPDYVAVNIREAMNIIKRYVREHPLPRTRPLMVPEPEPEQPEPVEEKEDKEPEQAVIQEQQVQEVVPEPEPEQIEEPSILQAETAEQETDTPQRSEQMPEKQQQKKPSQQPEQKQPIGHETVSTDPAVRKLLTDIYQLLKTMHREQMFSEFSPLKVFAGILQAIVVFVLVLGIWMLMHKDTSSQQVLICLGFAGVVQLMSLTLYVMQEKK